MKLEDVHVADPDIIPLACTIEETGLFHSKVVSLPVKPPVNVADANIRYESRKER